jgi:DNA-binding response OmpR family regulator
MRGEPHILFVDDDPDIREMVQALLPAAGFQVFCSENAADVLQLAATECFDVLVLDYWMPQVTGLELCRQIRRFDQNTPILICSGAVSAADKEAALLAGAQGYLGKPFSSKDLIRELRSVLPNKILRLGDSTHRASEKST